MIYQTFTFWDRVRFRWSMACDVFVWAGTEYGTIFALAMFGFVLFWHPFCRLALWLTASDPALHADLQETIDKLTPTLGTPWAIVPLDDSQGSEGD